MTSHVPACCDWCIFCTTDFSLRPIGIKLVKRETSRLYRMPPLAMAAMRRLNCLHAAHAIVHFLA
jgi:hypothetical protein